MLTERATKSTLPVLTQLPRASTRNGSNWYSTTAIARTVADADSRDTKVGVVLSSFGLLPGELTHTGSEATMRGNG